MERSPTLEANQQSIDEFLIGKRQYWALQAALAREHQKPTPNGPSCEREGPRMEVVCRKGKPSRWMAAGGAW